MANDAGTPQTDTLAQVEHLLAHFEQLEQQFQAVREGLTHSHRLTTLGTLASILAHEYNNILTPIISYAQLALSSPNDHGMMVKALEKTLAGAERAAAISSSLLGFARDGEEPPVAAVRQTLDDAIQCMARDPRKDGIDLKIDLPDARVAMSPIKLQQVLLNLLLNARKAMRHHGGRLSIMGKVQGEDLHLWVRDTGPGIPPSIMGRLFEPFVTQPLDEGEAQLTGRHDHKGTGLGLCICRDLVRSVGGEIDAQSEPGHGATFHLRLPLATMGPRVEGKSETRNSKLE
jgi:signal transduction histidine kinase